jgi:predicted CopG family antitoxin
MAVKTITIDMVAYEALARRKRAGESFSDVIKTHFATGGIGRDLLTAARRIRLESSTIESLDQAVSSRKRSRARVPQL